MEYTKEEDDFILELFRNDNKLSNKEKEQSFKNRFNRPISITTLKARITILSKKI
jgi:hypothetical protein